MSILLKINSKDNVAVALSDIDKGTIIENVLFLDDVKKAHKVAIKNILKGESIIKYGMSIGSAKEDIKKGEHVHVHNVRTNLDDKLEYAYEPNFEENNFTKEERFVKAYRRSNGEVAIRNELYIIPTVGCTNRIAQMIAETFKERFDVGLIDGVQVITHPYGCSQMGDDHENTKLTLQNIARHPNAGGVLIVGLGCENNQVGPFMEGLNDIDSKRVKALITQDVNDEIEVGLNLLEEIYGEMVRDQRENVPLSEIKFGLECGGSDGFSGITANVLLGAFSDYIVGNGGTTVLTEVPEMFGAETILMNRSESEGVFSDVVSMINNFKDYYKSNNQVIYDNPSPGNKAGGITTLEEKSLGCCEKAGKSNVKHVLKHNELIEKRGLNLLSAPGNDMVATTALGASGCHLVLFTTGRGTPYGGFIPTVKISTNNELYKNKRHWIDYNAGVLADGETMDTVLSDFLEVIIKICSGEQTRNEINRFREIAIFKSGVTL